MLSGLDLRGCWEMTAFAPRSSGSAMMASLSKALSAIKEPKGKPLDERRNTDCVMALPRHEREAHKIAERARQSEDFGGHAAFGFADGLARNPPSWALSVTVVLTMMASITANSVCGWSGVASNIVESQPSFGRNPESQHALVPPHVHYSAVIQLYCSLSPKSCKRGPVSTSLLPKVKEFGRVISVILLMDMRTRFGASYFGYLIAIAWPLSHLIIISGAYLLRNYVAPVGESPAVFVATGVVPYILCLYPARMLGMAAIQGRTLLNMPILKPGHLIAARWILEVLGAFIVLGLYLMLMYSLDIDFTPADYLVAFQAILAAVYLGVGFGVLNTAATAIFGQFFLIAFTLSTVLLYLISGAYVPSYTLTEDMREYYSYNPLFQIVEWLRSAYYTSYDSAMVDKVYVIEVASISFALGLLGERFLRGRFFS